MLTVYYIWISGSVRLYLQHSFSRTRWKLRRKKKCLCFHWRLGRSAIHFTCLKRKKLHPKVCSMEWLLSVKACARFARWFFVGKVEDPGHQASVVGDHIYIYTVYIFFNIYFIGMPRVSEKIELVWFWFQMCKRSGHRALLHWHGSAQVFDDPSTDPADDHWLHPCECVPASWGSLPPAAGNPCIQFSCHWLSRQRNGGVGLHSFPGESREQPRVHPSGDSVGEIPPGSNNEFMVPPFQIVQRLERQ